MKDVNHALDILKTLLELDDLPLNANGQAELVFNDAFTLHLTKISGDALELSFRLPELDYASPSMMAAMLSANFLGTSTGAGRLALDSAREEVIFCERWFVTDMTAESIERRFRDFTETGAFWLTEGSRILNNADTPWPTAAVSRPEVSVDMLQIRI